MLKKTNILSKVSMIFAVFVTTTTYSGTSYDPYLTQWQPDMSAIIRTQTDEIKQLKSDVKRLTEQLNNLELAQRDDRVIFAIIQYYKDIGYIDPKNPYCLDPRHLAKVWQYCKKWSGLLEHKLWIVPAEYMLAVCVAETNFLHGIQGPNENGTMDFGITQLNSIHFPDMNKKLPPGLIGRDARYDLEANIAARFIWINDRIKANMRWSMDDKCPNKAGAANAKRAYKFYSYITGVK